VVGCAASAGHAALPPVQLSAASQRSAADRHTVVEERKPSAGHAPPEPVHASATSHGPAMARQPVPASLN
jgi:hypothetical protein